MLDYAPRPVDIDDTLSIEVGSLAELLTSDLPNDLMAVPELAGDDIAVALNTAFAGDGAVVVVKDGARPSKPIE